MEEVIAHTELKQKRMQELAAWFDDPERHPPPKRFQSGYLTSDMTVAQKALLLAQEYPIVRYWNQKERFRDFVERVLFLQITMDDFLAAFGHPRAAEE